MFNILNFFLVAGSPEGHCTSPGSHIEVVRSRSPPPLRSPARSTSPPTSPALPHPGRGDTDCASPQPPTNTHGEETEEERKRRKKKTRTVFSRSQVGCSKSSISLYLSYYLSLIWAHFVIKLLLFIKKICIFILRMVINVSIFQCLNVWMFQVFQLESTFDMKRYLSSSERAGKNIV